MRAMGGGANSISHQSRLHFRPSVTPWASRLDAVVFLWIWTIASLQETAGAHTAVREPTDHSFSEYWARPANAAKAALRLDSLGGARGTDSLQQRWPTPAATIYRDTASLLTAYHGLLRGQSLAPRKANGNVLGPQAVTRDVRVSRPGGSGRHRDEDRSPSSLDAMVGMAPLHRCPD